MTSQGPNNGSTFIGNEHGDLDHPWVNPSYAQTSDDSRASVYLPHPYADSAYLEVRGFGFNIPAGNTIDGIKVEIERSATITNSVQDYYVMLEKNSETVGQSRGTTNWWPTSDAYATYGGETDLWNATWTPEEVNSANFGMMIEASNWTSDLDPTARVDHIRITIYYSPIHIEDSGLGSELVSLARDFLDMGTGVESLSIRIPLYDVGLGTEFFGPVSLGIFTDSARGTEAVLSPYALAVSDDGKFAEFGWRLKGYLRLDDHDLPHVTKLTISERVSQTRKPVMRSNPRVAAIGRLGRVVAIEGWTDDKADVQLLRSLKDGAVRAFMHPSGDSFPVRVHTFNSDNAVDEYGRRVYTLTLWEVR